MSFFTQYPQFQSFKQHFVDNMGVRFDSPEGLQPLLAYIRGADSKVLADLLPNTLSFFEKIHDKLSDEFVASAQLEADKAQIQAGLLRLRAQDATSKEKKDILSRLFQNAAIQQFLAAQLRAHQEELKLSNEALEALPQAQKQSFVDKALSSLFGDFSKGVLSIGTRADLEYVGLACGYFISILSLPLDMALYNLGVDIFGNRKAALEDLRPEFNPASPFALPPAPAAPAAAPRVGR